MGKLVRQWTPGILLAASLLTAPQTAAQDEPRAEALRQVRLEKAEKLQPSSPPGRFERFLRGVEARVQAGGPAAGFYGIRPKAGGLKPGAGIAGGVAFSPAGSSTRLHLEANAVASLKKYWGVGLEAGLRFRSAALLGYGRIRHLPEERFYGFGPEPERADYRLDEAVVGGLLGVRVGRGFSAGGRASYTVSTPGAGRDADVVDAVDRFAGRVPSLLREARHAALGAWVEFDGRDAAPATRFFRYLTPTESDIVGVPFATDHGWYALAEIIHYLGVGDTGSRFTRLHLQSQQFVPFRHGRNVFVFREYVSLSYPVEGHVPLYMQPSLGGAYTLRGYDLFQFRDRHALLLNAEYRWQIWLFLDLALFADAGQVFSAAADVALGRLHTSYGAGLRLRSAGRGLARLDVGRSVQGIKIHALIGASF